MVSIVSLGLPKMVIIIICPSDSESFLSPRIGCHPHGTATYCSANLMTIGAQWSQNCTLTAESTHWIIDSYLDLLFLLQGRQLAEAN